MFVAQITCHHGAENSDGVSDEFRAPCESDERKHIIGKADADDPDLHKRDEIDDAKARDLALNPAIGALKYEMAGQGERHRHADKIGQHDRVFEADELRKKDAASDIGCRGDGSNKYEADELISHGITGVAAEFVIFPQPQRIACRISSTQMAAEDTNG